MASYVALSSRRCRRAPSALLLALLPAASLVLLSACSGSPVPVAQGAPPTGSTPVTTVAPAQSFGAQLPALADLPLASGPARAVASAPYELLTTAPLASSDAAGPGSAVWSSGSLLLAPDVNGGIAWAVFSLQGFPTGGAVFPQTVASDSGPLWLGLSDYAQGRWKWTKVGSATPGPWAQLYGTPSGYVSPGGGTYVALVRLSQDSPFAQSLTSLTLTTNNLLFTPPTASLALSGFTPDPASGDPLASYPLTFDLSTSQVGQGSLVSIEFTPDTGMPPVTVPDLATPFSYTYATAGSKTATLTITTQKAGQNESHAVQLPLTLADPEREVLVVYNSNIPESVALADYYMSPVTGRKIDASYKLGLPLADSATFTPNIDRTVYASSIREPLKAFLDDPAHAALKADVKYILLLKGVPHQINGAGEFSDTADCASVDSELCCLYSDQDNLTGTGPGYPLAGWLENNPQGLTFAEGAAGAFYLAGASSFARGQYQVCYDPTYDSANSGDEVAFPLDYLVGRIDAYSYPEAQQLIDRARAADTTGTGWVVFDSSDQAFGGGLQREFDTMVDPVWPDTTNNSQSGVELLSAAGLNVFGDITAERIVNGSIKLPPGFTNNVIGYAGWGVNHAGGSWAHGSDYIWQDLGWNYLPGACFMSYESFNGTSFDAFPPANRRGQGQISDFFHAGGTCAIGNAWEPFTIGVGDERWVFDRYLDHGDRWIEAAYKGLRLISWMEVVVGDPLCRVQP